MEASSIPSTINIVHLSCKIKENRERGIKVGGRKEGGGRRRRKKTGKGGEGSLTPSQTDNCQCLYQLSYHGLYAVQNTIKNCAQNWFPPVFVYTDSTVFDLILFD
jgi:hypothetical protein